LGFPLSLIIADLVMDDLESKALERFRTEIPFYFRYVNDIATAIPNHVIKEFLEVFNSFHSRLQFTLEVGCDRLNFLDVTIIKAMKGKLEFNIYHKLTFSGRYLSFLCLQPLSQKKGVLMKMVDRTFLLSHPKYYRDNFNFIIKTFLDNNYPINLIFETINL